MKLFKKNKTEEFISNEEDVEIESNRLNIGKTKINPIKNFKNLQLTAFFIMIRNKYPDTVCTIESVIKNFIIPDEFQTSEIISIVKNYEYKKMSVELPNSYFVEIDNISINVNGSLDFFNEIRNLLDEASNYTTDIEVYTYNYNDLAEYLWNKILEAEYDLCMLLGNELLKFGSIFCYDINGNEWEVITKEDFEKINNKEYIVLKSKLKEDKMILIINSKRQILATGFNNLEQMNLTEILKLG